MCNSLKDDTVLCYRQKDLPNLQAGKKDSSKRSNSSDEANNACATVDLDESWRRPSSTGAGDNDSVYLPSSVSIQGDATGRGRHKQQVSKLMKYKKKFNQKD